MTAAPAAIMSLPPSRPPRVLLGVCGGIAAYKAVEVLRRLRERGFEVRCALTRGAASFVAPLTFEVLSEHAVYGEEYLTATGRGEESHLAAARWADVLCVAPATAHLLARLALGLADDFLTTTALAFSGPRVLAPAMHSEMWGQEAVQQHMATLRRRGAVFVGPEEGPLASGERGIGRFSDPLAVVAAVAAAAHRLASAGFAGDGPASAGPAGDLAGRTVVVSAGPTHEPIDPVRFLGNRSSGKMGFALAAEAARRGARTLLVSGPVALATPPGVERVDVETAFEMREALHRHAPAADLVVMTAAVGDFRPAAVAAAKIKRRNGVPRLELTANPDVLQGLADVAPGALRVGFAAETEASEGEAQAKLEGKKVELLVWNNVAAEGTGFGSDHNEVTVYRRHGEPVFFSRRPKRELAADLMDLFQEALPERVAAAASVAS